LLFVVEWVVVMFVDVFDSILVVVGMVIVELVFVWSVYVDVVGL